MEGGGRVIQINMYIPHSKTYLDLPGVSNGKESTCNAGDLGLIPGLGRFPGGGNGNLLQYSWAFLVAQLVQNPLTMQETWV